MEIGGTTPYGMGFDLGYSDVFRQSVRKVISDAAQFPPVELNLTA
ncbi:MAG: hypothetical protein U0930_05755 [Pirellulales bacterium]